MKPLFLLVAFGVLTGAALGAQTAQELYSKGQFTKLIEVTVTKVHQVPAIPQKVRLLMEALKPMEEASYEDEDQWRMVTATKQFLLSLLTSYASDLGGYYNLEAEPELFDQANTLLAWQYFALGDYAKNIVGVGSIYSAKRRPYTWIREQLTRTWWVELYVHGLNLLARLESVVTDAPADLALVELARAELHAAAGQIEDFQKSLKEAKRLGLPKDKLVDQVVKALDSYKDPKKQYYSPDTIKVETVR